MVRTVVILATCSALACGGPAPDSPRADLPTLEPPPRAEAPATCTDPYIGCVGGADEAPVLVTKVSPIVAGPRPEGITVLEVIIDRNGDVCAAKVLRGLTPEFDRTALEAVRQWKFEPARLRGEPVQFAFNVSIPSQPD